MQTKIIPAIAAFLFLVCFAGGCLRDSATAPTEPVLTTESATTHAAERPETTDRPDVTAASGTTTAAPTSSETASAASTAATTAPYATTTAPYATTTAPYATTTAPSVTTTAPPVTTTAQPTASQTQTTRASLIDRWRTLRDGRKAPKVDPAFFQDAVFVGDSVTMGLRGYSTAQRNKGRDCLAGAQFLCCGSMSYTNALQPVSAQSMHPTYKGNKVTIEDGVQLCGANKVFIMLGMNDFSAYREKTWSQNVLTLIDRIREKNPDAAIYLQSVTPILDGMEHGRFNNENIRQFNAYLRQVCDARGYTYVDIYSVLADENGCLKKSFCGDPDEMGIHMSASGCAAWAQYLQTTFCGE